MNKTFTFEIPGRLAGMNDLIGAINRHRYVGSKLKKDMTALCAKWVLVQRVPVFKNPVSIHFDWIEANERRDLDNIAAGAKWVLDSLVVTGRLQNDTRRWVREINHSFPEPEKTKPRVVVTLREIDGC